MTAADKDRRIAELMLFGATFFWGWTFPVVKEAISAMPIYIFLAVRFAIAAAGMACLSRRLPARAHWRFGAALGVMLFLSFAFQTWGLLYTSSANCAFITGLNVVWVMLFQPHAWRQALLPGALAVSGLWFLTSPDLQVNIGDILTLACSLFIALHILMLARRSEAQSSADLTAVQFWTVAAACAVLAVATGEKMNPADLLDGKIVFALLLTAGGATIFAFWAQTHFQRRTTPMRTGLIFICEPAIAAAFAAGFYGERLPSESWVGAVLIFIAMLLAIRGNAKAAGLH